MNQAANFSNFSLPFVSGICHAIPAVVWSIIAWDLCGYVYRRRPTSQFFRVAPIVAVLMALHFILHIVAELTPTEFDGQLAGLHRWMEIVIELIAIGSAGAFRHLVRVMPVAEERPSRAWLVVHYGVCAVFGLLTVIFLLMPGERQAAMAVSGFYMIGIGALSIHRMRELARRGAWDPGGLQIRVTDVAFGLTAMLGGGGLMLVWILAGDGRSHGRVDQALFLLFHTAYGLGFAAPFAARMLGRLIRVMAEAVIMLAIAAMYVWLIVPRIEAIHGDEARHLAQLAAVILLALLLGSLRALMLAVAQWKRSVWEQGPLWRYLRPMSALFEPSPRVELQKLVATVSPEAGVIACCERALDALIDVLQLRGAAIVLLQGRGTAQRGTVRIDSLAAFWSALPSEQLPIRSFAGAELRELPLAVKEKFIASGAVGVIPIRGSRRLWGHLFMWTGFLETATSNAGVESLQSFADQLGLVLDSAELLARALDVERSLAHAEKLAAIGELAARVAHEIRNPVTAARSLAQQLARESDDQFRSEHAVILTELERVERQVAALLRFARRDELRFEAIELTALVHAIADEFRARCNAEGIQVEVAADTPLTARADREKLRQVFINLMENAVDALGAATAPRVLQLAVARQNGCARLAIKDNGIGAPADALPHLFEPFFSLKAHGTGLGLSIAKRTIEAHGGRISVSANGTNGLAFAIELPLVDASGVAAMHDSRTTQ